MSAFGYLELYGTLAIFVPGGPCHWGLQSWRGKLRSGLGTPTARPTKRNRLRALEASALEVQNFRMDASSASSLRTGLRTWGSPVRFVSGGYTPPIGRPIPPGLDQDSARHTRNHHQCRAATMMIATSTRPTTIKVSNVLGRDVPVLGMGVSGRCSPRSSGELLTLR